MVRKSNAKEFLHTRGNSLKDTAAVAGLDNAVPPQNRNSTDGQDQNSRRGHHPTCGVMCEKTSTFLLKTASKGLH